MYLIIYEDIVLVSVFGGGRYTVSIGRLDKMKWSYFVYLGSFKLLVLS